MPPDIEQRQYVTFESAGGLDAVPTSVRGAWRGVDYTPFDKMGPRVGENRAIPGVAGRLEVPREVDELRFSFRMKVKGRRDIDGTPYADRFEGAHVNLDYLTENVLAYLPSRAITFHRGGALGDKVGSAIIDDWDTNPDPGSEGDVHLLVVQLVVATPALVLVGS